MHYKTKHNWSITFKNKIYVVILGNNISNNKRKTKYSKLVNGIPENKRYSRGKKANTDEKHKLEKVDNGNWKFDNTLKIKGNLLEKYVIKINKRLCLYYWKYNNASIEKDVDI